MNRKFTIWLLLATLLMGGCIKEDLSECPESLRIYFSHTINNYETDLIKECIGHIHVYVFDQNDILVHLVEVYEEDIDRGWIDVDLPAGTYTLSVWGGKGDFIENGFQDSEMTDPVNAVYTDYARIGTATLEDFRMLLRCDIMMPDMDMPHPGEISPVDLGFDDFFTAPPTTVEIVSGTTQSVYFDLFRDSNILNVKISGVQNIPGLGMGDMGGMDMRRAHDMDPDMVMLPFVCIAGHNGRYRYDNSIDGTSREVCYEPLTSSNTDTEMNLSLKVLRLDISRFETQPVVLHIRNMDTGEDVIDPIDVIDDVILKARDDQGQLIWPDQDAIDRETEFPIELSFEEGNGNSVNVSIIVKGFVVFNTEANVGRD